MKNNIQKPLFLFLVCFLVGCEQVAEFTEVATVTEPVVDSESGGQVADISFSGIDSIENVTDSTLSINWTPSSNASGYFIYNLSTGASTLITNVGSVSNYNITGLSSNTTHRYRVRAIDLQGFIDLNTNDVTVTTNNAPDVPSLLTLENPVSSPSNLSTPTIRVGGVKSGDTVKIFSNSDCSTEIGSSTSTGETVDITSSSLSDGSYAIYANSTGENTSSCSSVSVSYVKAVLCPTDYIIVPSNTVVGTTRDFCVMKYEAKDVGGVATSQASGNPWVNINQNNAYTQCNDLNTEGSTSDKENDTNSDGTFALISNPEWMTIARNIETNTENEVLNWSGGSVGTGILARGWASSNSAVAPSTGASCLYNSAGNTCAATGDLEDKRVLTLSNGEEIWDLSGNVWEWVDWTLGSPLSTNMSSGSSGEKPYSSLDGVPVSGYRDYTQVDTFSVLAPDTSIMPTDDTLDATFGIGRYYAGTAGGAALRGGYWSIATSTGAFALSLSSLSSSAGTSIGFRCVFRLP